MKTGNSTFTRPFARPFARSLTLRFLESPVDFFFLRIESLGCSEDFSGNDGARVGGHVTSRSQRRPPVARPASVGGVMWIM